MPTADRVRLLIASQPLGEGVPHHVLDLIDGLDPARYELDVACPRASTLWRALEGRDGVRLHALTPYRRPAPADAPSLLRLLRLARRADIVHAHSSKAGLLARVAAAATGRRQACVFTPHAWSFWATGGPEARLYRVLERVAAHWCRAIVSVSEHERRAGLSAGVGRPEQYRVIPNGIDLERFAASPAPVAGRVLMVGRLAPPKRPDLAVEAIAKLHREYPEAELQLAGDGPDRADVERLARQLGVEEAVQLLGTREDVPELLREASCLLLTSDYEGCPLSVLEAMAAGVPVVATRVGGVPELVDHGRTGLLVDRGDRAGVTAAVGELLGDSERARRIGAAGRRAARERFSRQRMVADTVELYEEIVPRGRSGIV